MSDDLDIRLRDRARAARDASVPSAADIEHTLAEITSGAQVTRLRPVTGRSDRRWYALAGAAAAAALFVGGAVWLLGGDEQVRTTDPTLPSVPVTAAPITVPGSAVPATTPGTAVPATVPATGPVVTSPVTGPPSTEPAAPSPAEPSATTPPTAPPTTGAPLPSGAPVLDGLSYEYAGFRNTCDADGWCTQVRFDPIGAPVTYDPVTRTVARHMRDDGTTVQFTLPPDYADAAFMAAGPDQVVYFSVPTDDEFADAVAFSIAAADAGREIVRIPDAGYGPGDADFVPGPDGLVVVGWYAQGWQPADDAFVVLEWVDRSGAPTTSPLPLVQVDFHSHDVRIGERIWSVGELPVAGIHPSTPSVLHPTLDGGFVARWDGGEDDLRSVIVRGWADGTVEHWVTPVPWTDVFVGADPMGYLLVPDGEHFMRAELFPVHADDYWDGPLEDGIQAGGPLNVYLHANDPWWEHASLTEFANAVVGPLGAPSERRTIDVVDPEAMIVEVTTEGFLDDSVAGGRTVLDVARTPEGFRLESVTHLHACQPGRGPQTYAPEPCI